MSAAGTLPACSLHCLEKSVCCVVSQHMASVMLSDVNFNVSIRCRAFDETKRELLAVEGHKALLSDPHTSMLQAKLKLRGPYITPLNILQVPRLLCYRQWFGRNQSASSCQGTTHPAALLATQPTLPADAAVAGAPW